MEPRIILDMKPGKDLFHAMAMYVTKKETKDIEALVQGRSLSPFAPPSWGDLLGCLGEGEVTQVFENTWTKIKQDSTRNFANNLEKMFLETPAESDEDALHIGFLFCNLLKLKGTPSSDPKLLELCERYLTQHPEIDPEDGTTFNLYIPKSLVGSFPGGRFMREQNDAFQFRKEFDASVNDCLKTVPRTDAARDELIAVLKGLHPIIVEYRDAVYFEKRAVSNMESLRPFAEKPVDMFLRPKDQIVSDLITPQFLAEIIKILKHAEEAKEGKEQGEEAAGPLHKK